MDFEKSTAPEKKLYTGIVGLKVIAVNPTKEEQAELLGYELTGDSKDLVYEGQTEKGEDYVSVVFWFEADTPEKQKFNIRFRLVNKVLVSENSGKTQWVNQSATSTWVDEEANLATWFTDFRDKNGALITKDNKGDLTGKKKTRKAIQGEANLYNFLRAWFSKVNFFSERTNILLDIDKMFRNLEKFVDSEFRSQLRAGDDALINSVVGMIYVNTSEKDGEVKMYQNVYGDFLSQGQMKKISFALSTNNWEADKGIKKWKEQLEGKHGCNGSFTISMLQPFDAANCMQSGNDVIVHEQQKADDIDF